MGGALVLLESSYCQVGEAEHVDLFAAQAVSVLAGGAQLRVELVDETLDSIRSFAGELDLSARVLIVDLDGDAVSRLII